jgi:hypothetical protein
MNWDLLVAKPAKRELERLPRRDHARRIWVAFVAIQTDRFSGDIKRIEPSVRRRASTTY